jgi:hypothetical protein
MIEHISFASLVDLVEGRRAPDERTRAHIAACRTCAADIAWIERVIDLMRTDQSQPAGASSIVRAKQLFRAPIATQPPSRRRVVAAMSFDSLRTPLAFGIRSGAPAERQLLFDAERISIDLRIAPSGAQWVVSGQLLGAESGRLAELHGPESTLQARLNDLSEFSLPPAPAGEYTLTLQLLEFDIEIPGLALGV